MEDYGGNPWLVGTITSVLSGLAILAASRLVLSLRSRREYEQKLSSANQEVIGAIRPSISEGHVPERGVVETLINATARKYTVAVGDMYDAAKISEDITKEVMDSSFITAAKKLDYYKRLEALRSPASSSTLMSSVESDLQRHQSQMASTLSGMLGVMTGVMTALVFTFANGDFSQKSNVLRIMAPALAAFFVVGIVGMAYLVKLKNPVQKRREKQKPQSEIQCSKIE